MGIVSAGHGRRSCRRIRFEKSARTPTMIAPPFSTIFFLKGLPTQSFQKFSITPGAGERFSVGVR